MTIAPNIIAAAQQSERRYKIPASVTIAQWAHESGWGAHMPLGSNNPFGIKARAGEPRVDAMTSEVVGGRAVRVSQAFRKFDSLADAFEAHARLLALGKPYARARAALPDPDAFAHALTGVYATDPNYGAKLIALMRGFNLYQYDKSPVAAPPPLAPTFSTKNIFGSPTSSIVGVGALLLGTFVGVAPEKVQPFLDAILQITGLNLNSATNPVQWMIAGVLLLLINGAIVPRAGAPVAMDDDPAESPCFPLPEKESETMSLSPQIVLLAELVQNDGQQIVELIKTAEALLDGVPKFVAEIKSLRGEVQELKDRLAQTAPNAEAGEHLQATTSPQAMQNVVDAVKALNAREPAQVLKEALAALSGA